MRLRLSWIIAAAIAIVIIAQLQLHWHVAAFLRPQSWPPASSRLGDLAGRRSAAGAGQRRRRLRAMVGVQTGFNPPDAEPRYKLPAAARAAAQDVVPRQDQAQQVPTALAPTVNEVWHDR